jgi:ribose 1,5-bisphosphokinase
MRGSLIYLIGPSGAGKDSLLQAARERLGERGCEIARRVITRSAEALGEDAVAVTPAAFAEQERAGAFAMSEVKRTTELPLD